MARLDFSRTDAATACPDEQALRSSVAARLGYDPFIDDAERRVRVAIDERSDAPGYVVDIQFERPNRDEPGVRKLTTADTTCRELADALVFTVSVAIDPSSAIAPTTSKPKLAPAIRTAVVSRREAVTAANAAQLQEARRLLEEQKDKDDETSDAPPAPDPEADSNAEAAHPPAADKRDVSTASPPLTIRGIVGGGAAFGAAPNVAASLRAGVNLGIPHASLELGGRVDLPTASDAGAGELRTLMALAEVAACGHLSPLYACGLFGVGSLRVAGVDLPASRSHGMFYSGLGGRLGLAFDLVPRVDVRIHGELLTTLARTRAVVGDQIIWRTPAVSGGAGVGFALEL